MERTTSVGLVLITASSRFFQKNKKPQRTGGFQEITGTELLVS